MYANILPRTASMYNLFITKVVCSKLKIELSFVEVGKLSL